MSDEEVKRELLAQIRARRDEMENSSYFWSLFDDGAEFGPPKPEPEVKTQEDASGMIYIHTDGRSEGSISKHAFEAIKKLGAEEAKSE